MHARGPAIALLVSCLLLDARSFPLFAPIAASAQEDERDRDRSDDPWKEPAEREESGGYRMLPDDPTRDDDEPQQDEGTDEGPDAQEAASAFRAKLASYSRRAPNTHSMRIGRKS